MPRVLPTSFYIILFFVLIAANVSIYKEIFAPRVLKIMVLDVGKGDATLLRSPGGSTILIDAGPDASILRALGENLPEWQKSIDAVVLTGTKSASVGGLPALESRYHVSKIIHIGDVATPFGTILVLDSVDINIISPVSLNISYGSTSFKISSSTPKGVYISDGKVFNSTSGI